MADGDRIVTHDDLFHHEPEDFLAFRDLQGLGASAQACPEIGERLDQAQVLRLVGRCRRQRSQAIDRPRTSRRSRRVCATVGGSSRASARFRRRS